MAGRIFISYRRADDPGYTQALFQRLEAVFGRERLFMDIEGGIGAGHDFVRILDEQIAACDVLIAVIGPRWIDAHDEAGRRRLDNPEDFVSIEIASALRQGKRVIPVLVNNAAMPRAEELPDLLKPLTRRNAVRLTIERFAADCAGLVKALEGALAEVETARAAKTEMERVKAEAAARRQADEEARRAAEAERQAEARAQEQVRLGMGPDEIRKAEELAHWNFISSHASVAELRDHIARFPGGVTEHYAREALEEEVWLEVGPWPSIDTLRAFIAEFPNSTYATEAKAKCKTLIARAAAANEAENQKRRETEAWAAAIGMRDLGALEAFLKKFPDSDFAPKARAEIDRLKVDVVGVVVGFIVLGMLGSIPVGIVLVMIGFTLPQTPQSDNMPLSVIELLIKLFIAGALILVPFGVIVWVLVWLRNVKETQRWK